ncbi:hypothetical protein ZWY2020_028661 [Hordeum vulgare]|nr:hypothetical protein ZWY2020_028661 [Hordeum vulgare]
MLHLALPSLPRVRVVPTGFAPPHLLPRHRLGSPLLPRATAPHSPTLAPSASTCARPTPPPLTCVRSRLRQTDSPTIALSACTFARPASPSCSPCLRCASKSPTPIAPTITVAHAASTMDRLASPLFVEPPDRSLQSPRIPAAAVFAPFAGSPPCSIASTTELPDCSFAPPRIQDRLSSA